MWFRVCWDYELRTAVLWFLMGRSAPSAFDSVCLRMGGVGFLQGSSFIDGDEQSEGKIHLRAAKTPDVWLLQRVRK